MSWWQPRCIMSWCIIIYLSRDSFWEKEQKVYTGSTCRTSINPNPFFLRPCGSKRAELESRKKGLQSLLQTSSLLSDARPQTRLGKARASSALLSLLLRFKGTRLNLLRGKTALRKGSCVPLVASGKAERWYRSRAFALRVLASLR